MPPVRRGVRVCVGCEGVCGVCVLGVRVCVGCEGVCRVCVLGVCGV